MMTQQLGFSVLSAPIAALDRRALSQAWYSALHLAHGRPAPVPAKATRSVTAAAARTDVHAAARTASRCKGPASATDVRREQRAPRTEPSGVDRRSVRSPLARKIEHTFLHPARRTERATFTLEGSNARIHVSLQMTSGGLRLVAVCAPRVRDAVAKALSEARFALAARGIAVDARVVE